MLNPTYSLLLGTLILGLLFTSGCIHHPSARQPVVHGHSERIVVIHTTPARDRHCVRHQSHWDCRR